MHHLKLGESFAKVKKVISVSILYFLPGEGEDDYIYKGSNDSYDLNTKERLRLKPGDSFMVGDEPEARQKEPG